MKQVICVLLLISISVFALLTADDIEYIARHFGVEEMRAKLIAKVIIEEYERDPIIDPLIVVAVIAAESSFKNRFGDHGSAVGYMQLHIEAVWYVASYDPSIRYFLVKLKSFRELINFPAMQIRIGYRYIALLTRYVYHGNLIKALDGYNGRNDYGYVKRVLEMAMYILELLEGRQ